MREVVQELRAYLLWVNKKLFFTIAALTACAIWGNYSSGWNETISGLQPLGEYLSWFGVFLAAFGLPYIATAVGVTKSIDTEGIFWLHLLLAPAIFAWKMSASFSFTYTAHDEVNRYWNTVLYWPIKLGVMATLLFIVWRAWNKEATFYGMGKRPASWRPYLMMLLIMIPLIGAASTQPDFLAVYPKLKHVDEVPHEGYRWFYALLYELCYGLDFVGIELFFRGFLIIGFARWAGRHAILPMAVFYCTIHFGKPLGECISSFFGGLILGVVTYHSRTIWGGLMVHLGIAWLMELGGYLGNGIHH